MATQEYASFSRLRITEVNLKKKYLQAEKVRFQATDLRAPLQGFSPNDYLITVRAVQNGRFWDGISFEKLEKQPQLPSSRSTPKEAAQQTPKSRGARKMKLVLPKLERPPKEDPFPNSTETAAATAVGTIQGIVSGPYHERRCIKVQAEGQPKPLIVAGDDYDRLTDDQRSCLQRGAKVEVEVRKSTTQCRIVCIHAERIVCRVVHYDQEKNWGFVMDIQGRRLFIQDNCLPYPLSLDYEVECVLVQSMKQDKQDPAVAVIQLKNGERGHARPEDVLKYLKARLSEPPEIALVKIQADIGAWKQLVDMPMQQHGLQGRAIFLAMFRLCASCADAKTLLGQARDAMLHTLATSAHITHMTYVAMMHQMDVAEAAEVTNLISVMRRLSAYGLKSESLQAFCDTCTGWLLMRKQANLNSDTATLIEMEITMLRSAVTSGALPKPVQEVKSGVLASATSATVLEPRDRTDILPTAEMLHSFDEHVDSLPSNRIRGNFVSIDEYIDTNFHLLRADCFAGLSEGIRAYVAGRLDARDMRVYKNVRLVAASLKEGSSGVQHLISFESAQKRRLDQDSLKGGNLVCISADRFQTLHFATVERTDPAMIKKGRVLVKFPSIADAEALEDAILASRGSVEMAESPTFFTAYHPVLRCLQMMSTLPMELNQTLLGNRNTHQVLHWEKHHLTHEVGPITKFNLVMDESQKDALLVGLNNAVALIQGPPGTGKSFVGRTIARSLMLLMPELVEKRPILVLTYKNLALDQFLEGCLQFTQNVCRLGSGSNSEKLAEFTLDKRRRALKHDIKKLAYQYTQQLKMQMHQLATSVKPAERLTPAIVLDHATPEQIAMLFDLDLRDVQDHREFYQGEQHQAVMQQWIDHWLGGADYRAAEAAPASAAPATASVFEEQGDQLEERFEMEDREADEQERANAFDAPTRFSAADGVFVDLDAAPCAFVDCRDVWTLDKASRRRLADYWCTQKTLSRKESYRQALREYEQLSATVRDLIQQQNLLALQDCDIIGMTTTGAAIQASLIQALQPGIVIVEEAGEILEAQLLACLPPSVKHLIMIGDHRQLQPNVDTIKLKHRNLHISMFERLIGNNVSHVTLTEQRRMHPPIAALTKFIYKDQKVDIIDHPVACERTIELMDGFPKQLRHPPGMPGNIFFWTHNIPEGPQGSGRSHTNPAEVQMAIATAMHLLRQGVLAESITILTAYNGQKHEFKRTLMGTALAGVAVVTVDKYQGDENDIILLSLVRSHSAGAKATGDATVSGEIGFLKKLNRVCVMMSRARLGLYVFGNADLLEAKARNVWTPVLNQFRARDAIGSKLPLRCQAHSHEIFACETAAQVEALKCKRPCEFKYDGCDHACARFCHLPPLHGKCEHACTRVLPDCAHPCRGKCSEPCPPCKKSCPKPLPCGHPCGRECSAPCASICQVKLSHKFADCNHSVRVFCSERDVALKCSEKVEKPAKCGHKISVTCPEDVGQRVCDTCTDAEKSTRERLKAVIALRDAAVSSKDVDQVAQTIKKSSLKKLDSTCQPLLSCMIELCNCGKQAELKVVALARHAEQLEQLIVDSALSFDEAVVLLEKSLNDTTLGQQIQKALDASCVQLAEHYEKAKRQIDESFQRLAHTQDSETVRTLLVQTGRQLRQIASHIYAQFSSLAERVKACQMQWQKGVRWIAEQLLHRCKQRKEALQLECAAAEQKVTRSQKRLRAFEAAHDDSDPDMADEISQEKLTLEKAQTAFAMLKTGLGRCEVIDTNARHRLELLDTLETQERHCEQQLLQARPADVKELLLSFAPDIARQVCATLLPRLDSIEETVVGVSTVDIESLRELVMQLVRTKK